MSFSPQQRQGDTTRSTILGSAAGLPLGIVAVYFLNTYLLPQPMPAEIGVAVGGMVNGAAIWVAQWLPQRRGR